MLKLLLTIIFFISGMVIVCGQPSAVKDPNLFPIYERGKIGYIDMTGKKVIEPRLEAKGAFNQVDFTPAQYFHEGVAVAVRCSEETGKCLEGFIDASGNFVIPPVYERALQFSEGLAAVRIEGQWGFINHLGVIIIAPQFMEADLFTDGLAVVTRQGKGRGLIDRSGRFLKMPRGVQDFAKSSENLIAVKIGGKWGFMNKHGKIVIRPRFEPDINDYNEDDYLGEFLNGRAIVKLNNKWGYINRQGKLIISANFHGVMPFRESNVSIVAQGLYDWRIINRQGDFVTRRKFEALYGFSENLAGVLINYKWGFVNNTGQVMIPAIFEQVRPFSDGLAAVQVNKKWGYIDRTGKFVIEPKFEVESYFSGGLAKQTIKHSYLGTGIEWGYLDRTGKFVWKSR